MNETPMNEALKALKYCWQAIFNVPPIYRQEGDQLMVDEFTFTLENGEWTLDVAMRVPAKQEQPEDVDVVELCKTMFFLAALRVMLKAYTDDLIEAVIDNEHMAYELEHEKEPGC